MISAFQFSGRRSQGMFDGRRGTYGTYSVGPMVDAVALKSSKEK
jgi:hypothetical protein